MPSRFDNARELAARLSELANIPGNEAMIPVALQANAALETLTNCQTVGDLIDNGFVTQEQLNDLNSKDNVLTPVRRNTPITEVSYDTALGKQHNHTKADFADGVINKAMDKVAGQVGRVVAQSDLIKSDTPHFKAPEGDTYMVDPSIKDGFFRKAVAIQNGGNTTGTKNWEALPNAHSQVTKSKEKLSAPSMIAQIAAGEPATVEPANTASAQSPDSRHNNTLDMRAEEVDTSTQQPLSNLQSMRASRDAVNNQNPQDYLTAPAVGTEPNPNTLDARGQRNTDTQPPLTNREGMEESQARVADQQPQDFIVAAPAENNPAATTADAPTQQPDAHNLNVQDHQIPDSTQPLTTREGMAESKERAANHNPADYQVMQPETTGVAEGGINPAPATPLTALTSPDTSALMAEMEREPTPEEVEQAQKNQAQAQRTMKPLPEPPAVQEPPAPEPATVYPPVETPTAKDLMREAERNPTLEELEEARDAQLKAEEGMEPLPPQAAEPRPTAQAPAQSSRFEAPDSKKLMEEARAMEYDPGSIPAEPAHEHLSDPARMASQQPQPLGAHTLEHRPGGEVERDTQFQGPGTRELLQEAESMEVDPGTTPPAASTKFEEPNTSQLLAEDDGLEFAAYPANTEPAQERLSDPHMTNPPPKRTDAEVAEQFTKTLGHPTNFTPHGITVDRNSPEEMRALEKISMQGIATLENKPVAVSGPNGKVTIFHPGGKEPTILDAKDPADALRINSIIEKAVNQPRQPMGRREESTGDFSYENTPEGRIQNAMTSAGLSTGAKISHYVGNGITAERESNAPLTPNEQAVYRKLAKDSSRPVAVNGENGEILIFEPKHDANESPTKVQGRSVANALYEHTTPLAPGDSRTRQPRPEPAPEAPIKPAAAPERQGPSKAATKGGWDFGAEAPSPVPSPPQPPLQGAASFIPAPGVTIEPPSASSTPQSMFQKMQNQYFPPKRDGRLHNNGAPPELDVSGEVTGTTSASLPKATVGMSLGGAEATAQFSIPGSNFTTTDLGYSFTRGAPKDLNASQQEAMQRLANTSGKPVVVTGSRPGEVLVFESGKDSPIARSGSNMDVLSDIRPAPQKTPEQQAARDDAKRTQMEQRQDRVLQDVQGDLDKGLANKTDVEDLLKTANIQLEGANSPVRYVMGEDGKITKTDAATIGAPTGRSHEERMADLEKVSDSSPSGKAPAPRREPEINVQGGTTTTKDIGTGELPTHPTTRNDAVNALARMNGSLKPEQEITYENLQEAGYDISTIQAAEKAAGMKAAQAGRNTSPPEESDGRSDYKPPADKAPVPPVPPGAKPAPYKDVESPNGYYKLENMMGEESEKVFQQMLKDGKYPQGMEVIATRGPGGVKTSTIYIPAEHATPEIKQRYAAHLYAPEPPTAKHDVIKTEAKATKPDTPEAVVPAPAITPQSPQAEAVKEDGAGAPAENSKPQTEKPLALAEKSEATKTREADAEKGKDIRQAGSAAMADAAFAQKANAAAPAVIDDSRPQEASAVAQPASPPSPATIPAAETLTPEYIARANEETEVITTHGATPRKEVPHTQPSASEAPAPQPLNAVGNKPIGGQNVNGTVYLTFSNTGSHHNNVEAARSYLESVTGKPLGKDSVVISEEGGQLKVVVPKGSEKAVAEYAGITGVKIDGIENSPELKELHDYGVKKAQFINSDALPTRNPAPPLPLNQQESKLPRPQSLDNDVTKHGTTPDLPPTTPDKPASVNSQETADKPVQNPAAPDAPEQKESAHEAHTEVDTKATTKSHAPVSGVKAKAAEAHDAHNKVMGKFGAATGVYAGGKMVQQGMAEGNTVKVVAGSTTMVSSVAGVLKFGAKAGPVLAIASAVTDGYLQGDELKKELTELHKTNKESFEATIQEIKGEWADKIKEEYKRTGNAEVAISSFSTREAVKGVVNGAAENLTLGFVDNAAETVEKHAVPALQNAANIAGNTAQAASHVAEAAVEIAADPSKASEAIVKHGTAIAGNVVNASINAGQAAVHAWDGANELVTNAKPFRIAQQAKELAEKRDLAMAGSTTTMNLNGKEIKQYNPPNPQEVEKAKQELQKFLDENGAVGVDANSHKDDIAGSVGTVVAAQTVGNAVATPVKAAANLITGGAVTKVEETAAYGKQVIDGMGKPVEAMATGDKSLRNPGDYNEMQRAALANDRNGEAHKLSSDPEKAARGMRNYQDPAWIEGKLTENEKRVEGLDSWFSSTTHDIAKAEHEHAKQQLAEYKAEHNKWKEDPSKPDVDGKPTDPNKSAELKVTESKLAEKKALLESAKSETAALETHKAESDKKLESANNMHSRDKARGGAIAQATQTQEVANHNLTANKEKIETLNAEIQQLEQQQSAQVAANNKTIEEAKQPPAAAVAIATAPEAATPAPATTTVPQTAPTPQAPATAAVTPQPLPPAQHAAAFATRPEPKNTEAMATDKLPNASVTNPPATEFEPVVQGTPATDAGAKDIMPKEKWKEQQAANNAPKDPNDVGNKDIMPKEKWEEQQAAKTDPSQLNDRKGAAEFEPVTQDEPVKNKDDVKIIGSETTRPPSPPVPDLAAGNSTQTSSVPNVSYASPLKDTTKPVANGQNAPSADTGAKDIMRPGAWEEQQAANNAPKDPNDVGAKDIMPKEKWKEQQAANTDPKLLNDKNEPAANSKPEPVAKGTQTPKDEPAQKPETQPAVTPPASANKPSVFTNNEPQTIGIGADNNLKQKNTTQTLSTPTAPQVPDIKQQQPQANTTAPASTPAAPAEPKPSVLGSTTLTPNTTPQTIQAPTNTPIQNQPLTPPAQGSVQTVTPGASPIKQPQTPMPQAPAQTLQVNTNNNLQPQHTTQPANNNITVNTPAKGTSVLQPQVTTPMAPSPAPETAQRYPSYTNPPARPATANQPNPQVQEARNAAQGIDSKMGNESFRRGSTNIEANKAWQEALVKSGVMRTTDEVYNAPTKNEVKYATDGAVLVGKADLTGRADGAITQTATKQFQETVGLPQTGTAGKYTKAAMKAFLNTDGSQEEKIAAAKQAIEQEKEKAKGRETGRDEELSKNSNAPKKDENAQEVAAVTEERIQELKDKLSDPKSLTMDDKKDITRVKLEGARQYLQGSRENGDEEAIKDAEEKVAKLEKQMDKLEEMEKKLANNEKQEKSQEQEQEQEQEKDKDKDKDKNKKEVAHEERAPAAKPEQKQVASNTKSSSGFKKSGGWSR